MGHGGKPLDFGGNSDSVALGLGRVMVTDLGGDSMMRVTQSLWVAAE